MIIPIKTAKKLYDEVSGKLREGQKTYLFFDEIQEVKDWEKAVNSLMSDYAVYVGKLDTREIDFVAVRADQKLYIQATTQIKSPGAEKREYENLLSIPDNYPKYVLRLDEFASGNHEGIFTMNITDFLLGDSW